MSQPEARPCGHRTTTGGRCAHLVTLDSKRCAALHPVTLSWTERRTLREMRRSEQGSDAAALGTVDLDEMFSGEYDVVGAELPPLSEEEKAAAQAALDEKRRLAAVKADENAERLAAVLPENVITLDLDGTMFDSWACCKKKETNWVGSEECRHLRQDTLDAARELAEEHNAALVVLSWRGGLDKLSREWIDHIGIADEIKAVFIPSGEDDITGHHTEITSGTGQVDFKVNTVRRLQEMGHTVVASFDDRNTVVKALEAAGSKKAIQVKHKFSISSYDWSAGRIGASKEPRPRGSLYAHPHWSESELFGVGPRRGRSTNPDPYDYGDALWDDDVRHTRRSREMSEDDFWDLVESGDAVAGVDYTLDERGRAQPLRRLRGGRDDGSDTWGDGGWDDHDDDLSDWVIDRYQGREDLIFRDGVDLENENPF